MTAAVATAITAAGRDPSTIALTIALSNDDDVRELNSQYRGKDQPTNVLSFPAGDFPSDPDSPSAREFMGDIILAYDTIEQEAVADSKSFAHHAVHMAVHGVLHLLGYDHEYDESAEEMERIEIEVLASLGLPNPYAENDAADVASGVARMST
jgi:probable rRNA maturation factor